MTLEDEIKAVRGTPVYPSITTFIEDIPGGAVYLREAISNSTSHIPSSLLPTTEVFKVTFIFLNGS